MPYFDKPVGRVKIIQTTSKNSRILRNKTSNKIYILTFKPGCVFSTSNGLEVVRSKRQAKHESANTGQAKLVGIEPSLCFKDI